MCATRLLHPVSHRFRLAGYLSHFAEERSNREALHEYGEGDDREANGDDFFAMRGAVGKSERECQSHGPAQAAPE